MAKFAKLTAEQIALIEDALPKETRLYLHAVLHSKPATNLVGKSAGWFEEWLISSGRLGMEWGDFRAVDFTVSQAASWLGKPSRSTAQDAISSAISKGYLELVSNGVKGHPSLYLIAPLPIVENLEFVPETPNKASTNKEEHTYQKTADTYQNEGQCVPTSPNKAGTTYNLTYNLTKEAQAACAEKTAPPVKAGERCPVCHNSRIATIDAIYRERGTSPKKELRGELRCPNCWSAWLKDGSFKKYGERVAYSIMQSGEVVA